MKNSNTNLCLQSKSQSLLVTIIKQNKKSKVVSNSSAKSIGKRIKKLLDSTKFYNRPVDTGKILSVKDGVAKANGL